MHSVLNDQNCVLDIASKESEYVGGKNVFYADGMEQCVLPPPSLTYWVPHTIHFNSWHYTQLTWTKTEERRGRMCEVPKLKGGSAVQKLGRQSFLVKNCGTPSQETWGTWTTAVLTNSKNYLTVSSSKFLMSQKLKTSLGATDVMKGNKLFGIPV